MVGGKRIQRKPEGGVSNLPRDIISSILLKSSVKSLLRFRCVSKSLLAIISEPQFVRSHLNESIKLDRQRIFRSDTGSDYFYSTGYGDGGCNDLEEKLCFPRKKFGQKARVVCSCNGLVLLKLDSKTCALWNPSTIAYEKLSCPSHLHSHVPYGLCYDSSMDDYKVIFIGQESVVVFSFKFQCWTEPKATAKGFPLLSNLGPAVIANGVLHSHAFLPRGDWFPLSSPGYYSPSDSSSDSDDEGSSLAYVRPHSPTYLSSIFSKDSSSSSSDSDGDGDGDDRGHYSTLVRPLQDCGRERFNERSRYKGNGGTYTIVYYDVVNEEFKEMQPPNCINEGDIFRLTVMRGCLSLYRNDDDENYVVVWTMKQYGEQNSWTKLFVIPRYVGRTIHLSDVMPLCATEKGEVVIIIGERRIAIYNPRKNKFRSVRHTEIDQCSNVVLVVDSLVLPIGNGAQMRKRKRKWDL